MLFTASLCEKEQANYYISFLHIFWETVQKQDASCEIHHVYLWQVMFDLCSVPLGEYSCRSWVFTPARDRNMLTDFTVTEATIAVVFDKLQIWIFWHRNAIFQTDISRKVTVFWDISLLRALMRILDLDWVFSLQIKNLCKKKFHYGCNKGRHTEETVSLISIGDTCNVSPFETEDLWLYTVSHFFENLGGNIYDF